MDPSQWYQATQPTRTAYRQRAAAQTARAAALRHSVPGAPPGVIGPQAAPPSTPPPPGLTGPQRAPKQPSVLNTQKFLIAHGYKITPDGIMGPQTASAIKDWHTKRDPKAWSAGQGAVVQAASDIGKAAVTASATPGATMPTAPRGPKGPKVQTTGPISVPTSAEVEQNDLLKQLLSGAQEAPLDIASIMKQFPKGISPNEAAAVAGTGFGKELQALGLMMRLQKAQGAQNQADISNWFGQVIGAQGKASANDAAFADSSQGSLASAMAAVRSSLGGSANQGENQVAGVGQLGVGTLAAINASQRNYDSSVGPLLQQEQAGEASRQQAIDNQAALQLQQQQLQIEGQRDQAMAQARLTARGNRQDLALQRLQTMLGLQSTNRQIDQQGFANKAGILQMLSGMQSAGAANAIKLLLANSKIQTDQAGAANDATRTQIEAQRAKAYIAGVVGRLHLTEAEINRMNADAAYTRQKGSQLGTPSLHNIDVYKTADNVAKLLGVGPNRQIPAGTSWSDAANAIGSQLQALGLKKGTPLYHRLGVQLISIFRDSKGRPAPVQPGWFA